MTQLVIKLEEDLRDRIKIEAARNRRSMTQEVLLHLERLFPKTEEGEARS